MSDDDDKLLLPLSLMLPSAGHGAWHNFSTPCSCKAKRQYLVILQVSSYCLLALHPATAAAANDW